MRNHLKKAFVLILALVLCLSFSGCYSEKNSWAAKMGDDTLPIGSYIYYLNSAYSEAASKVSPEEEVLKATVEGQDSEAWIRDRAMNYLKAYYYVDSELSRLGLELSDEEISNASSTTDSAWSYSQSYFENMGIAKESFNKAYSLYGAKYQKLMEALYAEDGEKAVSKEELETYFNDNYYYYDYFSASLSTADEDGNSVDLTDEEKADLKTELETYVADINKETTTMETAASDYAAAHLGGADQTTYSSPYAALASNLSDSIASALKDAKDNEAAFVESGSMYFVVCRRPLKDGFANMFENSRDTLVSGLKGEEYSDYVMDQAKDMEGITINESAIKRVKISSFVTDSNKNGTSSASSESSGTSSEASSASSETAVDDSEE